MIQAFTFGEPPYSFETASMNARTRPAVISYLSRYTVLPGWVGSTKPGTGNERQQLSCFAPGWPTSPSPHVSPPRCGLQLGALTHFFA